MSAASSVADMRRPARSKHLRIDVEPHSWVVEMAVACRSRATPPAGDLEALRERLRRMRESAHGLESRARKLGGDLLVETASLAIMYSELRGFVSCHGRINVADVHADRGAAWWHVVDLLRALDRLEGYDVRVSIGGRACSAAEAMAAVAPSGAASRGPSTAEVEAYARRVRLERQAKEPRRSRGNEPPYGPRAAAHSTGSTHGGSRRDTPPPRPASPPPAASAAAAFFLAKTGLEHPSDLGRLKKAFRRVVIEPHPDQRPSDRSAHEEFCRFKKGYDELVVEVTRASAR